MNTVSFAGVLQSILRFCEEDSLSQAGQLVRLVRIPHCHGQFLPIRQNAREIGIHTYISGCFSRVLLMRGRPIELKLGKLEIKL
jgi:hypothetical protein